MKKNCDYNLIMAGRDSGKSTAVCRDVCIKDYLENGHLFIRFFRRTGNVYDAADSWFDEFTTGGKFDCGHVITYQDGKYYMDGKLFGDTAIISLSKNYRSARFDPRIYNCVFDEYIGLSPDEYVDEEIYKFKALLTTVFRNRPRRVWLLGNNYNELSKYNPYHTYFKITDIDSMKQGDIRVYKSKHFKNPARIAFEFGRIAYECEDEIPVAERLDGNEVATSGEFARPWDVFVLSERYTDPPSFLRDSCDNYYISDVFGRCYFPVINEELQCIDWVSTPEDLTQLGKGGDEEKYNALITYEDYFIEKYGEEEYYQELERCLPYDIGIPLFMNRNRYGENCQGFLSGINKEYRGYTFMYCDGNIKYLFERIILQNKIE